METKTKYTDLVSFMIIEANNRAAAADYMDKCGDGNCQSSCRLDG